MNTLESKTTEKTETVREEFRTLKAGYLLKYELYREETGGRDAYSIQVTGYIDGDAACRSTAYDISSVAEAAEMIFEKIVKGLVTPVVLHEVLYELLP